MSDNETQSNSFAESMTSLRDIGVNPIASVGKIPAPERVVSEKKYLELLEKYCDQIDKYGALIDKYIDAIEDMK